MGYTSLTALSFSEEQVIDGFEGRRVEFNSSPMDDPEYRAYHYVVHLGPELDSPNLVAQVANDSVEDYELAKAVLDRIIRQPSIRRLSRAAPFAPRDPYQGSTDQRARAPWQLARAAGHVATEPPPLPGSIAVRPAPRVNRDGTPRPR